MIKIIDDALPEDMFKKCFDFLNPTNTEFDFHNENIPWTLGRDILTKEELNPKLKSTYQMHHMLFWDKGKSEHYDGCLSAIKSILPEFTEISLYRMKINALLNNSKVDAGITNIPHADLLEPHLSFVLYLNDSDGDTVFYKEKWDAIPLSQLTECKRVSPKKNRVVISDGNYHASQNPIDNEIRLILNAVIRMKEDNDKG